jgi:hypothetical protein
VVRRLLLIIALATASAAARAQQPTPPPIERTNASIRKALGATTDIEALNLKLDDFLKELARRQKIPMRLGKSGLRRAEVDPALEITASFKQVPLGSALRQILQPLKLQHRIVDGAVLIDDIGEPPDDNLARRAAPVRVQQVIELRGGQKLRRLQVIRAQPVVRNFNIVNPVGPQTQVQQLRQLLQIELNFVKTVCTPTPEQLRQLEQDGAKGIDESLKNWQVDNGAPVPSYAREIVQDEVMASARAHLLPAQIVRYDAELQKRKEFVHQACARNLMVTLDLELFLTAEQRQKLRETLAENWDDAWTVSTALTAVEEQGFIPSIPDELITPHLDVVQKVLWNRLPKRGKIIWGLDETAFLGMMPPAFDEK